MPEERTDALDLINSAQAAVILDKSVDTVGRWAAAGKLREAAKMPGPTGVRLFNRADVEALAAELAEATAPIEPAGQVPA